MEHTEGTTPGEVRSSEGLGAGSEARCWCHACRPVGSGWGGDLSNIRMVLCPDCGNKRCPKASDHRLACTSRNDSGQLGSVYGGVCEHPYCHCDETEPALPEDGSCAKGLPRVPQAPNV